MVIAGESLMNDGIAIVLFTLFKNMLQGKSYSVGDVIEFLCRVALGGPAVGLAFGVVALFLLVTVRRSYQDDEGIALLGQTTLTFVMAYCAFFVGEQVCEVAPSPCIAALCNALWSSGERSARMCCKRGLHCSLWLAVDLPTYPSPSCVACGRVHGQYNRLHTLWYHHSF